MKSARGSGLKKKRGNISSFLLTPLRLHSSFAARLLVSSTAAWGRASCESGDLVTPCAANSCSQHLAPHRRDRRAFFFFFFLHAIPLRVEEIGWILRSNHGQQHPISRVKSIINHNASRCVSISP